MDVLIDQLAFGYFKLLEKVVIREQALLDSLFVAALKPAQQIIT